MNTVASWKWYYVLFKFKSKYNKMTLSVDTCYGDITNKSEKDIIDKSNKINKIKKTIEKIDEKLALTKLEVYIIQKFGIEQGRIIVERIISFSEFLITAITMIGLLVTSIMTIVCIACCSVSASTVNNLSIMQNIMYILICMFVFISCIFITVCIVILLDHLQVHFIGISVAKKQCLEIKKAVLHETLQSLFTENHNYLLRSSA